MLSPPDPFSMIAMALPTILLYEASILAVDRVEKVARCAQGGRRAGAPRRRELGATPSRRLADRRRTSAVADRSSTASYSRTRDHGNLCDVIPARWRWQRQCHAMLAQWCGRDAAFVRDRIRPSAR